MAVSGNRHIFVEDPPIARALFSDVRFSWILAIIRLYLGYSWVDAGLHKVSNPAWTQTGTALKGYWERAVSIPPTGNPVITYDWYRDFINSMLTAGSYSWFGSLVAYGEVLIGIGLILGAFVGIAAFFGAFQNLNIMLAGTAGTNPVLFTIAILLILAWKTAGYWGLDRWLLPAVGTPWQIGQVFRGDNTPNTDTPRPAAGPG